MQQYISGSKTQRIHSEKRILFFMHTFRHLYKLIQTLADEKYTGVPQPILGV